VNKYKDRYIFEELNNSSPFLVLKVPAELDLESNNKLKAIVESSHIKHYDAIVIPDDILANYLEDDKMKNGEEEEEDDTPILTPWQKELIRRQKQLIVYHEWRSSSGVYSADEGTVGTLLNRMRNQGASLGVYIKYGHRDLMDFFIKHLPTGFSSSADWMPGNYADRELYFNDDAAMGRTGDRYLDLVNNWIPLVGGKTNRVINYYLFNAKNIEIAKAMDKMIEFKDVFIKKYDEDTGKLELGALAKLAISLKLINLGAAIGMTWNGNTASLLNKYNKSVVQRGIEVDKRVTDFMEMLLWVEYTDVLAKSTAEHRIYGADNEADALMANLASYAGAKLSGDETLMEQSLQTFNDSMPDYLCDYLDEVVEIDVMFDDYIKEVFKTKEYILRNNRYITKMLGELPKEYEYSNENDDFIRSLTEAIDRLYDYEEPEKTDIRTVFPLRTRIHEFDHVQSSQEVQDGQGDKGANQGI
jgi:hypothetical protein